MNTLSSTADEDISHKLDSYKHLKQSKQRTVLFMVIFFGASFFVMHFFHHDLMYYFHNSSPIDLGEIPIDMKKIPQDGSYVKIKGIVGIKGATVERVRGLNFGRKEYNFLHLLGSTIFFEKEKKKEQKLQIFAEIEIEGRIFSVHRSKKFPDIIEYFKKNLAYEFSEDSYVILADDVPGKEKKYPILYAVLIILMVINIVVFIKKIVSWKKIIHASRFSS